MILHGLTRRLRILAAGAALVCAMPQATIAFDDHVSSARENGSWTEFRNGYTAYRAGDMNAALSAYKAAANHGHCGANWKLAHMYADGEGVQKDVLRAFNLFEKVVETGSGPGSPDDPYVADALVSLATYLRNGIPNSPVQANKTLALELLMRAASLYGHPQAQYEIGMMTLHGERPGGVRQAARWLRLAVDKGHLDARVALGQLLIDKGHVTDGLVMLGSALRSADGSQESQIRAVHEKAYAGANASQRSAAENRLAHVASDLK